MDSPAIEGRMTDKDHDVDLKATERHSIESLEDRLRESEEFNATLTHLLVASYRLHSSLDYVELIRIIKEIMINLVGAKVFGVFLVDKKKNAITMITNEGFDANAKEQCGRIAKKIIATGELWYAGNKMLGASGPIAGIPLKIADNTFGAIVLHKLLSQKKALQPQDFDIFEMLGQHAATALYASKLSAIFEAEKKMNIRHQINDLIPPLPSSPRNYLKAFEAMKKEK